MTTEELIKKLCKDHGISVRKLEQDLGFSNGYIAKPKQKRGWETERLLSIANYFGVELTDLLYPDGETKSKTHSDQALIQQAFEKRSEMRVLFSLVKDAPTEDIEWVIKKLKQMQK